MRSSSALSFSYPSRVIGTRSLDMSFSLRSLETSSPPSRDEGPHVLPSPIIFAGDATLVKADWQAGSGCRVGLPIIPHEMRGKSAPPTKQSWEPVAETLLSRLSREERASFFVIAHVEALGRRDGFAERNCSDVVALE